MNRVVNNRKVSHSKTNQSLNRTSMITKIKVPSPTKTLRLLTEIFKFWKVFLRYRLLIVHRNRLPLIRFLKNLIRMAMSITEAARIPWSRLIRLRRRPPVNLSYPLLRGFKCSRSICISLLIIRPAATPKARKSCSIMETTRDSRALEAARLRPKNRVSRGGLKSNITWNMLLSRNR